MSQETLTAPKDETQGLTPDQMQTAIDLRQNIKEKDAALSALEGQIDNRTHTGLMTGAEVSGPTVVGSMIDDMSHGFKKIQLASADRAAAKHYEQNMGAYQEQAAKDAAEAGVELNGWSQK